MLAYCIIHYEDENIQICFISLNGGMGLQVEVPVPCFGHTAVHHCPRLGIGRAIGIRLPSRIEPRVVAFADNDDTEDGLFLLTPCTCGFYPGQFLSF